MIGSTVSHYKILQKLGEGGMGVVYKAQDMKLLRPVALKFLSPELTRDQDAKRRFVREARAASALDHPNIAVVHDIDETDDGRSFICMAYYEGQTLAAKLSKGLFEVLDAVRIAEQIASGLETAHDSGIVHRDIKPSNLIITPQGEIKIVDFGLAKLSEQARETRSQVTGGTAAYMSPEQILGNEADARSDLFSLGVVLYECVTGQRPFPGDHEAAVYYSIVNSEPAPLSTLRTGIPQELQAIISRLLEKDPKQRYQNASAVVADLKHILGETPTALRIRHVQKSLLGTYPIWAIVGTVVVLVIFTMYVSGALGHWFSPNPPVSEHVSIAVLPFEIRGADSSSAYQLQGLFETITIRLNQLRALLPNINVVGISSSRDFKNAKDAYEKAAATVALKCLFEYAVNRIQIKISLEDTKTLRVIDANILDRTAVDLRLIEADILQFVIDNFHVNAKPADLRGIAFGDTEDDEANRLNLQAKGELQNYMNSNRLASAISLFQKALARDPNYALAHAGLGEAYWRSFEMTKDPRWIDSAEAAWSRANTLNRRLPDVHRVRGMLYRGQGRYLSSIEELQTALSLDSLNADAYRELGDSYGKIDSIGDAERAFKRAIELQPKNWTMYNSLAKFYYNNRRNDEAIAMWNRVVELAPGLRVGYSNLGAIYFNRLRKWREAIAWLERARQIDTSSYITIFNLGVAYYYDGLYERSAAAFERAASINGGDYKVYGGLGAAYRAMGSKKMAQEAYEEAVRLAERLLKVNPKDADLLSQLSGFYADVGRKNDALASAQKALALAPKDGDVLQRIGLMYELVGARQQALETLTRAVTNGAQMTEIAYSPEMKQLREDPAYQKLMGQLKTQ
jgi:eukaryotic-like serine/threonine-protein kinase